MKIREHYIDVAKGMAMLLVIIGHITIIPRWLYTWINSFHMPLFFFLSGLVYNPHKYDKFKDFFKAKFKGLLIPYFFFTLIIWFWTRIFRNPEGFLTMLTLEKLVGVVISYRRTNFYASLWFFLALFLSEILMYPIIKIIDKKITSKKKNNICLIVTAIISSIIGFVVLHFVKGGFVWSLDLVPLTMCFVMLGYVAKTNKEKWNKIIKLPFALIYLGTNVIFAYLNWKSYGSSSLYGSNVGNYIYYMIAAITGTLFIITLCKKIDKNKILEYIGRNTMIYYSFQKPVILPTITTIITTLTEKISVLDNIVFEVTSITIIACIFFAIISEIITNCFPYIIGKSINKQEKVKNL